MDMVLVAHSLIVSHDCLPAQASQHAQTQSGLSREASSASSLPPDLLLASKSPVSRYHDDTHTPARVHTKTTGRNVV